MTERIGILVGQEQSFPQAFIAKVNETPGFRAEFARVGGTPERFVSPYRALIDRISHEVTLLPLPLEGRVPGRRLRDQRPLLVERGRQILRLLARLADRRHRPRTMLSPQKDYLPVDRP